MRIRVFESDGVHVVESPLWGKATPRAHHVAQALAELLPVALAAEDRVEVDVCPPLVDEVKSALRLASLDGGLVARSPRALVFVCKDARKSQELDTLARQCMQIAG